MTKAELKLLELAPRALRGFYTSYLDICRFIIVGGIATCVHFSLALSLHHFAGLTPLWANFFAFCTAFIVTYLGNYFWAFESSTDHISASLKSLSVSVTGLCLSQLIVWGLTEKAGCPFYLTLFASLLIVPIVTFSLNRYWVFRR